jgi:hypothetical protein
LKDAIDFAFRIFLKHGIWIVGAACLVAVGSRVIFVRAGGEGKSSDDAPEITKRRIILGVIVLVIGIVIALIPIK